MTLTALDRPPLQDNLTESDAQARAALLSNLSYEVSLVLSDDPDAETFQSATTIVFDAAHEGSETFINIAARSIDECTLNGKRLSEAQHGFDGNVLWLRGLRAGSNRLSVTAQCEYQHTGVGLHRLRDPVDDEVYVYTHFEPFDAHKVLACFDQPDLKAGVTMSVTAPSAWRVCSNGRILRTEPRGALKTWHFNTTPPLPPYLIAVVAGKYHTVERKHRDIPMALWCRESLAEWIDAQADEIFDITTAGLDFFEKYFGLKYPFDEYNQLFVPEFNMGAMENPGCVTFNEAYIHRGQASEAQLQRRAETILHEMAHVHGFGDVTTMRWWGDLWLNETFATYMANLAMEKSTRFTNAWVDFANSVKSIAARQDQLVTTHRIADHVPDTVSVRQNFDGITYHKGASVMKQLVAWVGDDAFMRGVQDYFKRYRWGNADLQEFLDCLRRASGRDLTRWGQDWLQTTGLNTFHALLAEANGRYTSFVVEQTAIPTHPTLRAHRAGVGLYDYDAKGMLRLRRRVETDLTGALTPINELVGERVCDLVLLNDGDLTFAKLRFDPRSLETLKADLSKLADPLARALCWAAMWDLTRDGEMPAREFVELVARHAPAEEDSLLVERVTSQARSAIDLYGDPGNRTTARERLHQVAVAQANNPGLAPRDASHLGAHPRCHRGVGGIAGKGGRHARWLGEHPRHRHRHRSPLADPRPAQRRGARGRRPHPGDDGVRPERHRSPSRDRVPRRPADRCRKRGSLGAGGRCERTDARCLEGRHRWRAFRRLHVGDPSRLLHRLGGRRRPHGARPGSGAAPAVRPALPGCTSGDVGRADDRRSRSLHRVPLSEPPGGRSRCRRHRFRTRSRRASGSCRADPARRPRQHAAGTTCPRSGPSRRALAGGAAHPGERLFVLVAAWAAGRLPADADAVVDRRETVDSA